MNSEKLTKDFVALSMRWGKARQLICKLFFSYVCSIFFLLFLQTQTTVNIYQTSNYYRQGCYLLIIWEWEYGSHKNTNFTIMSVVKVLSFILSLGLAKQCTEVRIHFLNFLYTKDDILRQTSIPPYRKGSGKKDDLEKHM